MISKRNWIFGAITAGLLAGTAGFFCYRANDSKAEHDSSRTIAYEKSTADTPKIDDTANNAGFSTPRYSFDETDDITKTLNEFLAVQKNPLGLHVKAIFDLEKKVLSCDETFEAKPDEWQKLCIPPRNEFVDYIDNITDLAETNPDNQLYFQILEEVATSTERSVTNRYVTELILRFNDKEAERMKSEDFSRKERLCSERCELNPAVVYEYFRYDTTGFFDRCLECYGEVDKKTPPAQFNLAAFHSLQHILAAQSDDSHVIEGCKLLIRIAQSSNNPKIQQELQGYFLELRAHYTNSNSGTNFDDNPDGNAIRMNIIGYLTELTE